MADVPDILEVAKVEIEVTVRVAVHVRHPVVVIGICPETILFIERGIPLTFRQLVTLLIEDEGHALRAGVDGLLSCQERHALLGRCGPADYLLERPNAELVAGLENAGRVREFGICDRIVVVIELFRVLLTKRREPLLVHVVIGHRNDT